MHLEDNKMTWEERFVIIGWFSLLTIQGILFSMIISYLFTNPSVGRDISFLFNIGAFAFGVYCYSYDYHKYTIYYLPYQGVAQFWIELQKSSFFRGDPYFGYQKQFFKSTIQIFLSGILVFYIDQVAPREDDNRRPWNFFFLDFKQWLQKRKVREVDEILGKDFESQNMDKIGTLEIKDLNKKFGDIPVLKNLNLKFQTGNFYCLLGHNGAGKSTFINILTGLYQPTNGNIYWEGKDFRELKRNSDIGKLEMGFCPSFESQWENLTVFQHLKIFGYIKQVKNINAKIQELLDVFGLNEYKDFQSKALSGGNKRKLTIAMSVMGNPQILFLDEPTSSVDPKSRKDIWNILEKLKNDKKMITILTTHHLEEAEFLSDDISVLQFGKIIVKGTVNDIVRKFGVGYQIEIFPDSQLQEVDLQGILQKLKQKFQFQDELNQRQLLINISMDQQDQLESIVQYLEKELPKNYDFFVNSNTLEKAYLDIDLKQSQEYNHDLNFNPSMVDNLYTGRKISSFKKIYMIAKNKIQFLTLNLLELVKFILNSSFCLVILILLLELNKMLDGMIGGYIYYFLYFQVIIEISCSTFSAYNIVFEKENDIKILMHSHRISITEYYLGKILADIILNIITFSVIYIGFIQIAKTEIQEDEYLLSSFNELLIKIIFWKISFQSFSYLIAKYFTDKRSFLKFFPFVYGGYMGILSIINLITKLDSIYLLSDVMQLMYIGLSIQQTPYYIVFPLQSIFFLAIVFILDHYELKYNYIVQNRKSPTLLNQVHQHQTISHDFVDNNDTIAQEQDRVMQDQDMTLRTFGLYKKYKYGFFRNKEKIAVRNISFGIHPQGSLGLVGPNGAGKTTTFNMILNKVVKSGGMQKFKKMKIQENYMSFTSPNIFERFRFGASFQGNTLWEELTVQQNLEFYSTLNQVQNIALDQIVHYFEFEFYLKKKVRELSSGNKRKLCIIISFLTNPEILLYDEATCGVDIVIRQKLQKIFQYIKNKNNAISIFTTHFLKDIEIFCDKLGLIKQGQFVCIDYLQNIKQQLGGYLIKLENPSNVDFQEVQKFLSNYGKAEIGKNYKLGGKEHQQFFLFENKKILQIITFLLKLKQDNKIHDFVINQLSIEDIYLNMVDEEQLIIT